MKIVTIFNDSTSCLSQKATPIPLTPAGLEEARIIAEQLLTTLTPLMPAAGLAAPQIGISKQVFIYSWDRSAENMEVVINPNTINIGSDSYTSWESCFSTIQDHDTCHAALVSRSKELSVEYTNLEGNIIRKKLQGFGAKVFQHEYDHLQGIVDTQKPDAELKTFNSKQELIAFMTTIKKEDGLSYIPPMEL